MQLNQNYDKNEITLDYNPIYTLFLEFLKIINCEGKITNDEITIWDLFYIPTITLDGKTFTFDADDIEINTLLGGNGKKYTIPFEYTTNDNLRKIKCDKLGTNNAFLVSEKIVDNKNREIGQLCLEVSQSENNLIEIYIPQTEIGIHFKLEIKKEQVIECTTTLNKFHKGKNEEINIKYISKKNSNEKELILHHMYLNRITKEKSYSTIARFNEHPLRYPNDNRSGHYLIQHTNAEKREIIKNINLEENNLDLYFEDLCFHTKQFISILKSNLCSLSPTFLNALLLNYPEFIEFLEKMEKSQDNGILTDILNNYFQNKKQLELKRELNFLSNPK